MNFKTLFRVIGFTLLSVMMLYLTPAIAKEKIIFGQAASLSGPNAVIHTSGPAQTQQLWVDEVNAKGGIYVKELGKRLPIELIVYDDKSDHGTLVKLLEKLMVQDKVDFILPPCGTSYLFAAAPVANKNGYILLGNEGGATSLESMTKEFPYLFCVLNYSNHYQIPLLADQFAEWGIKTVALTYNDDLHGVEYEKVAKLEFEKRDIQIVMSKSHAIGIKDMSPILKEAKRKNVDAFCSFSYPNETFLVVKQAIEIDFNPKVFQANVGVYMPIFPDIVGAGNVEGVIGGGAWSPKQSAAAKHLYDTLLAQHGKGALDMWGNLYYYGALQFFEQAIESAGTLDQKKIRDIMATKKFTTALGPTWFDDMQRLARECHPGEYGQWINGEWEVVLPVNKATAQIQFPKPPWPKK